MPRDRVGFARPALPLELEEVYHLSWRWVRDLLDDAVVHVAGLAEGCPAPLAPLLPFRRLYDVWLRSWSRLAWISRWPARKPLAAVCAAAGRVHPPRARRAQAQHHQPRKRNQFPRIHEGGRRPQGSREDGEGGIPLDLQSGYGRTAIQTVLGQDDN